MPAPTFVSSSPANAATNVFLNKTLTATFDTTLLASSVNSASVVLKAEALGEIVDASITVDGTVITIVPHNILIQSSSYSLALIGTDLALGHGPLKAADGSALATTTVITFQTGTSIDTPNLEKTEEEIALEGDAFLPSDLQIIDTSFAVFSTNPVNHAFGIRRDKEQIVITFTDSVNSGTVVDGSTFQLTQTAFLDEEGLLAVTGSGGNFIFQCATGSDATLDYSDITGALSVTGAQIVFDKDTSRNWPANSCVEVFLGSTIADTGGNTLGIDQKITFYTKPFPDIVGLRALKHEMGTLMPNTYLDDYLGLKLWMMTIETWEDLDSAMDLNAAYNKNRSFKEYVRCRAALDIIADIRGDKDLSAGTSKTLADFRVSYFPAGSDVVSRKEKRLEELCDRAWTSMVRHYNRPSAFVKGVGDVVIRGGRGWSMPTLFNNRRNVRVSDPIPAGNTANERVSKVPGYGDVE